MTMTLNVVYDRDLYQYPMICNVIGLRKDDKRRVCDSCEVQMDRECAAEFC